MNEEIEISQFGSLLVYKRHYTPDCVRSMIKENNLSGLRIFAQLKEDRLPDLDFLHEYAFLEALDITTVDDYDFNFLNYLHNLKELTISTEGRKPVNLSSLKNLSKLTIQWRKGKIIGLEKCKKLNSLCIIEYTEDDLTPFKELSNLKDLKVKTSSIKSLKGIENFADLNTLLLGNCKKLMILNGLEYLQKLTWLSFQKCPFVKDYSIVGRLKKLEKLEINDSKDVISLKFIEELIFLKRFAFLGNTNILDGNLKPADKVDEVFYTHREHYNVKLENKNYEKLVNSNLNKIRNLFK